MPKSPTSSDLISPEYLAEQKRLHADPRGYGGRGDKWASTVSRLIIEANARSILDYGCGQATLEGAVTDEISDEFGSWAWRNYDPARKDWNRIPDPANQRFDLVVCSDVLEHIEEDKINAVLSHLRALTRDDGQLFTVISLVETAKTLSDGRQAHILLRDEQWWREKMLAHRLMWDGETYPNPKPEKQFVATWRPL